MPDTNGKKGIGYWIKFWPIGVALVSMIAWGIRLESKADTGAALREAVIENTKYRVEQTSPAFIELQKESRLDLLDKYATDDEVRIEASNATVRALNECKELLKTHRENRH